MHDLGYEEMTSMRCLVRDSELPLNLLWSASEVYLLPQIMGDRFAVSLNG